MKSSECKSFRYGKSLDRRSKIHKKIAIALSGDENITKKIEHLKQSMEDVSMVAQLEGYKHEQLLFVDEVLKHLGNVFSCSNYFLKIALYL